MMAYNTSIIDALDELAGKKKTFSQDNALGQPRNMRSKEIRPCLSVMAARSPPFDEWLVRKVTSSHATPVSSRRGSRACS